MKPLIVLGLFLVGCSGPGGSVVSERRFDPQESSYYVLVGGEWIEVTAEEFRAIDVGDSWLAPE